MNEMVIDFLYLDLYCCERCQSTDETLDEALMEMRSELRIIDRLTVNKIRISSKEDEDRFKMKRSPTIRINGQDIEEIVSGIVTLSDNYCQSCSDVIGEETNCRTFEYNGETSENIPKDMIKEGINKVLNRYIGSCFDDSCGCG